MMSAQEAAKHRPTHTLVATGERVKLLEDKSRGWKVVLVLSGPLTGARCSVQGALAPIARAPGGRAQLRPVSREAMERATRASYAPPDLTKPVFGSVLSEKKRLSALRAQRMLAERAAAATIVRAERIDKPAVAPGPTSLSKHDFLKEFSHAPVVLPSSRSFVVGQPMPMPLLAGWNNKPLGGEEGSVMHKSFAADKRAFSLLVHVYERQVETLVELGARWALLARIEENRQQREESGFFSGAATVGTLSALGSASRGGASREGSKGSGLRDVPSHGPLRAVPSAADTAADILEAAALLIAEMRLTLLKMVQLLRHCQRKYAEPGAVGFVGGAQPKAQGGAAGRERGGGHRRAGGPRAAPAQQQHQPANPVPQRPRTPLSPASASSRRDGHPPGGRAARAKGSTSAQNAAERRELERDSVPLLDRRALRALDVERSAPDHTTAAPPNGAARREASQQSVTAEAAGERAAEPAKLWHGFNHVLKAFSDFWRLPLPTASDPFTLHWFTPESSDAMATEWRLRFAPEASHSTRELAQFREADAYMRKAVIDRQRWYGLNQFELRLPSGTLPSDDAIGLPSSARRPASRRQAGAEAQAVKRNGAGESAPGAEEAKTGGDESPVGAQASGGDVGDGNGGGNSGVNSDSGDGGGDGGGEGKLVPLSSEHDEHHSGTAASLARASSSAGAPLLVGAQWLNVAAMLYGTAEGFASRKQANEIRRHAASSIAMLYRRHALQLRCALRLATRQQRCASTIQSYWRRRKAPGTFKKAFTRQQKAELNALLDARIARRRVGARRRGALFSAMREYGGYEMSVIKVQVHVRIFLSRRMLRKLRLGRTQFRRKLAEHSPALTDLALRWQRQMRRWRDVNALAWSEYTRTSLRIAHAPLHRYITAPKPEIARAQQLHETRTAALRALHGATPVGAQSDFFNGLGATAFTHGVQLQLIDCLQSLDPALLRAALEARPAGSGGAAAGGSGNGAGDRAASATAEGATDSRAHSPTTRTLDEHLRASGLDDAADAADADADANANLPVDQLVGSAGNFTTRNSRALARVPSNEEGSGSSPGGLAGGLGRSRSASGEHSVHFERVRLPPPPPPPSADLGAIPMTVAALVGTPTTAVKDAHGWIARRLAQLEEAEEAAASVQVGSRIEKLGSATLQHMLEVRLASSRTGQLLDGSLDEAEALSQAAPWAVVALCGNAGHFRKLAREVAAREALRPVRQLLVAAVDYETLRGRINQLHELQGDSSLQKSPTAAVAKLIASKLEDQWDQTERMRSSWLLTFAPYVSREALTVELDRCEGSRRLLDAVRQWEGLAVWQALLARRQALIGQLAASRSAKAEYKAAVKALSIVRGARSVVDTFAAALKVPPTTFTIRCTLPEKGCERLNHLQHGELARAFSKGFAADIAEYLNVPESQLELMEPPEHAATNEPKVALVRFRVRQSLESRLGHPHELVHAIEGALDTHLGTRELMLSTVAELLRIEDWQALAKVAAKELPNALEINVKRSIVEQLKDAEELVRDSAKLRAAIDDERARRSKAYGATMELAGFVKAAKTSGGGAGADDAGDGDGDGADGAEEPSAGASDSAQKHAAASASAAELLALLRADEEEARAASLSGPAAADGALSAAKAAEPPPAPHTLLGALSRSAARPVDGLAEKKRALYWLDGRASVLKRLEAHMPKVDRTKEAREWLGKMVETLDAELSAQAREPEQVVAKLGAFYASRRAVKRNLASTMLRVRQAREHFRAHAPHVALAVRLEPPTERTEPWVSLERHADERRLFGTVAQHSARMTAAELRSVSAASGAQPGAADDAPALTTGRVRAVMQLQARPSLLREDLRELRPADVLAMAELIGVDTGPTSSEHFMLWVAVEAILAPLPPLWRETNVVPTPQSSDKEAVNADAKGSAPPEPRFLGDVRFVNTITGEERDEHPLLDAFRAFVKRRRTFGLTTARKFAHYDSWMQFSDGKEGCFYFDFSTGARTDQLPRLRPKAHKARGKGQEESRVAQRRLVSPAGEHTSHSPVIVQRVFEEVNKERVARIQELRLAAKRHVIEQTAPAYKKMRSLAIRLKPCPVAEIFIAATALGVPIYTDPEMAWLPELLHSFSATMPAAWSAHEETNFLTGAVTGVSYDNVVTEARSEQHPFLTEARSVVMSVRAAMEAKLKQDDEYQELDFLVNRSTKLWGDSGPELARS